MRLIALARLVFIAVACALPVHRPAAQETLPILKSQSNVVTVIDGDHVKQNYWVLMPERNPDIYYVEIPMKPHEVTFRSDIDSLTVPVKFGDRFDFVILLNDQTACRTQIRAEFRKLETYSRIGPPRAAPFDTIPFRLGDNDKIYIRGRLNGGEMLDFQFDLGCGGAIIKRASVPKAAIQFDGTANLINSDGNHAVRSSSANRLEIGNLRWEGLSFLEADNMTHREDGLLGNALFQDKVVEINYDRNELRIHDHLPSLDSTHSKHAVILDGIVPFIQGSLTIAGHAHEGWFMFDTGAYTSILRTNQASPWSKLFDELRSALWIGSETRPRLSIGDHAFEDFNYVVTSEPAEGDQFGLLGNDLLKRFNVILDNQNGFIYLQPNAHANDPYANPEYYLARAIVAGGFLLALGGGAIVYRRRRKADRRTNYVPLPQRGTSDDR